MHLSLPVPLSSGLPDPAVVVVTGASSGIGAAVALRLAAQGHHVVLVSRTADDLDDVAARCRDAGCASATVHPADVGDDAAVQRLFDDVVEQHSRIDGVAHCAGQVTYGRVEESSAEVFDQVLSTNVSGAANIARHALKQMRAQRRGVLVLVGSLLGHVAVPEMTPYVVSKWAVRSLARQLSVENVDLPHVRISHVAPGSVDTPIYDRAIEAGGVNSPPPPTISPERVARVVVGQLRHPMRARQTAWSNHVLILAFRAAPWAYDRLVGPAFRLASRR